MEVLLRSRQEWGGGVCKQVHLPGGHCGFTMLPEMLTYVGPGCETNLVVPPVL